MGTPTLLSSLLLSLSAQADAGPTAEAEQRCQERCATLEGTLALDAAREGAGIEACQALCKQLTEEEQAEEFWQGRAHPRLIWEPTRISDTQLCPSGDEVAYVRRLADWDEGSHRKEIWLASTDGRLDRPWTTDSADSWHPRWSADGRSLAFISKRSGDVAQVFRMSANGGEARQVTQLEEGVSGFAWTHDGGLALLAPREETAEEKAAHDAEIKAYRYDKPGRGQRLGLLDEASGEVDWRTTGLPGEWPAESYRARHVEQFATSPDGERLALVSSSGPELYHSWLNARLEVLGDDGEPLWTWEARPFHGHAVQDPQWSPDGRLLAFITYLDSLSLPNALVVADPATGRHQVVNDTSADTLRGFTWLDARSLAFVTQVGTRSRLERVRADGSGRRTLLEAAALLDAPQARAGELVLRQSTRSDPGNLHACRTRSCGALVQLTDANPQLVAALQGVQVRTESWTSDDGTEIEGVLSLPPQGTAPYTLLLWPHGGPDSAVSLGWRRWAAFFAANGYAVLEPNFRGSTAYGLGFYQANRGRLGETDLQDNLSGVQAMADRGIADPTRLLVGGISYGGTMAAQMAAKTDHFKAIVSVAGVSDAVSNYGLSDVNHGVAAQWEFLGDPVNQPDNFIRASAIYQLETATTPTLIMHGEDDQRVDVAQSKELYRALIAKGAPTELVIYPDEGHGVQRSPAHLADHLRRWLAWYETHLPEEPKDGAEPQ